jgi:hypothetical protein
MLILISFYTGLDLDVKHFYIKLFVALFFSACYRLAMETKKITKEVEAALLKRFGTHTEVAKQLGITYSRYCQIRSREEKLTRSLAMLVDMRLEAQNARCD